MSSSSSTTSSPVAAVSPLEMQVSTATNQMGLQFMQSLPANAHKDNIVLSPLSLQIILNLILLGAKDSSATQQELSRVLGYDSEEFKSLMKDEKDENKRRLAAHEGMQKLVQAVTKSLGGGGANQQKELEFSLANMVLTNTEVATPALEYLTEAMKHYDNTRVEELVAKSDSTAKPHEKINKWVSEATKQQITQLVAESDLPQVSQMALVLLNAANFKGKWLSQFQPGRTTEELFYNHGQESEAKKVKFMHQTGQFSYLDLSAMDGGGGGGTEQAPIVLVVNDDKAEAAKQSSEAREHLEWANKLDARVLSLPFSLNKGQELDMLFVLPNKRDGLAGLIRQLSSSARALATIFRELDEETRVKVQVGLPKFKFESTHDAKSVLATMGLGRVFSEHTAELDRMFKQPNKAPVRVDKLIHKAKISVDESGAEAAAATVAVMATRSMSWDPLQPFLANRPFLFLIRHKPTGLLLFAGAINSL